MAKGLLHSAAHLCANFLASTCLRQRRFVTRDWQVQSSASRDLCCAIFCRGKTRWLQLQRKIYHSWYLMSTSLAVIRYSSEACAGISVHALKSSAFPSASHDHFYLIFFTVYTEYFLLSRIFFCRRGCTTRVHQRSLNENQWKSLKVKQLLALEPGYSRKRNITLT